MVIVVSLKPRLLEVSKSMGCVNVPSISVFDSIQSLRGPLDFEDIDASTTGTP